MMVDCWWLDGLWLMMSVFACVFVWVCARVSVHIDPIHTLSKFKLARLSIFHDDCQNPLQYFVIWLAKSRNGLKIGEDEFFELSVKRKLVDNVENYLNMKFQPTILTRSQENPKKPHFLTYFLIWLPSICENRPTVFTKVVDNDPRNISGKFEANILKTFRNNGQKPLFRDLTSQIEK